MADVTLRERNQRERKTRVLMVAMKLAAHGGYDAVQMRDVASESGVALSTIYRYFGSKDELLLAGFSSWVRFTRDRLRAHGPVGDTAAQRVSNAMAAAVRKSDEQPKLMEALILAMGNNEPDNLPHKIAINESFGGIIADAVGDDGAEVDVDGLTRVLNHVWFSASTRWVGGLASSGSVAEELRHAVSMLMPHHELLSDELIDLGEYEDQSGWVSSSMHAEAGTAGLNK